MASRSAEAVQAAACGRRGDFLFQKRPAARQEITLYPLRKGYCNNVSQDLTGKKSEKGMEAFCKCFAPVVPAQATAAASSAAAPDPDEAAETERVYLAMQSKSAEQPHAMGT